MQSLKGTGVALVTPFTSDNAVDVDALKAIVKFQIENGVDYLVVLGTTGEVATLNKEEKQQVIETVISANAGKLPLVLGIGGNNTQEVVEAIKSADLTSFEAILSVSPYYNKPSQEGIYRHYKALSQVSPKPIIVYNVPGRTASNILPETIARLAQDCSNIIGIKEAKGDIVQAMKMIASTPDEFLVISGDDMITLPMVLAGGAGVISVIGEGFPKEFSTMVNLGLQGKNEDAFKIHHKLAPAIDYIFEEGNPVGIKAVFNTLGLCNTDVRLPLVEASSSLQNKITAFIKSM